MLLWVWRLCYCIVITTVTFTITIFMVWFEYEFVNIKCYFSPRERERLTKRHLANIQNIFSEKITDFGSQKTLTISI